MWKYQSRSAARWLVLMPLIASLAGCASAERRRLEQQAGPEGASAGAGQAREGGEASELAELRQLVSSISARIDGIEARLQLINERFEHAGFNPKLSAIQPHPAEGVGGEGEVPVAASDPEAGYAQDGAVAAYREALILFQAGKSSEAILGFSGFLERFADHPLAGSAQFHVGEAYYRQKEYGLAAQEFERVLTSYDRSPRVADALQRLAAVNEALNRPDKAARYRQSLLSLFPASPAAGQDARARAAVESAPRLQLEPQRQPQAAESGIAPVPDTAGASLPALAPVSPAAGPSATRTSLDEPPPTAPMSAGAEEAGR